MKTLALQRLAARWGFIGLALLCALILLGSATATYQHAQRTEETLARGEGQRLARVVAERLWPPPPSQRTLEDVVAELAPEGLRYAALIGREGQALIAAGAPLFARAALRGGDPFLLAPDGACLVQPLGPPRRGGPPPFPPHHEPRPPRLRLDFQPLLGAALLAQAERGLVVAVVVSGVLLLSALLLTRLSGRRDEMEARLRQERHLAALGEMSAVLAHEIRNPLASLKGHSQLMTEQIPAEQPRLRGKAERIVREAERLEALVSSLLSFARAGRIDRRPASPAQLLGAAAEAVDPRRCALDVADAPATFSLDPIQIEQVLANLLRNALQASPADTQVEASVRLVDGALCFVVRDHGAGVPEAERRRIFEPFYTTRVHGTGLGLALARRIAEAHGGHIAVDDHPGGGARFHLLIPAQGG